jgi:hypothetical protein
MFLVVITPIIAFHVAVFQTIAVLLAKPPNPLCDEKGDWYLPATTIFAVIFLVFMSGRGGKSLRNSRAPDYFDGNDRIFQKDVTPYSTLLIGIVIIGLSQVFSTFTSGHSAVPILTFSRIFTGMGYASLLYFLYFQGNVIYRFFFVAQFTARSIAITNWDTMDFEQDLPSDMKDNPWVVGSILVFAVVLIAFLCIAVYVFRFQPILHTPLFIALLMQFITLINTVLIAFFHYRKKRDDSERLDPDNDADAKRLAEHRATFLYNSTELLMFPWLGVFDSRAQSSTATRTNILSLMAGIIVLVAVTLRLTKLQTDHKEKYVYVFIVAIVLFACLLATWWANPHTQ